MKKNNFNLLYLHTAAMVSKNFNTVELNCFRQFFWESSLNFEWTLERERDIKDIYWEVKVREFAERFWSLKMNMLRVWGEYA